MARIRYIPEFASVQNENSPIMNTIIEMGVTI
jgi:hypothetical protein